jgi:hypothetical protein
VTINVRNGAHFRYREFDPYSLSYTPGITMAESAAPPKRVMRALERSSAALERSTAALERSDGALERSDGAPTDSAAANVTPGPHLL